MRDLILVGIFAAILPFALRHTWIGVLLWTWISLMNPHKLAYGFASTAPLAAIAAGVTVASLVVGKDKLRQPFQPPMLLLLVFILWVCLTTLTAFEPSSSQDYLIRVLKIQLMTLVAAAAIASRRHIEAFVWVVALSIGFYGFKGGIFTIASGGSSRVWGPAGTFIEGNNEVGLALVMSIPLLNYLRMVSVHRKVRLALATVMGLAAAAALGTQSRGALLAIAAMTLMLWQRSQRRGRMGVLLAVLGTALVVFMPDSWTERMSTIRTYESDGSAMGRIEAWRMAFNLANDRIFGGGFSVVWQPLFDQYSDGATARAAHSIYFQVLGEHGWIGLLLFLSIGATTWAMAASLRRQARLQPGAAWVGELAAMVQVAMVGYAVGGAFLSLAYFDLPYNFIVIVGAMRGWMNARGWESEPKGLFSAGDPIHSSRVASSAARAPGASAGTAPLSVRPPPP